MKDWIEMGGWQFNGSQMWVKSEIQADYWRNVEMI